MFVFHLYCEELNKQFPVIADSEAEAFYFGKLLCGDYSYKIIMVEGGRAKE